MRRIAVLIAGPTAGGKSSAALALAEALAPLGGGAIINADSMQVYRELRLLTARPSPADEARAPHHLYGVWPASVTGSAMAWRAEALAAIEGCWRAGQVPIVVGGSGLYFKALIEGLAPVPNISDDVRRAAREMVERLGVAEMHRALVARDPAAAGIRPSDRQRLVRAWEVLAATGTPLSEWQRRKGEAFPGAALGIVLSPPRPELVARITHRIDAMVAAGVLDEVAAFLDLGLPPDAPARGAVGLEEFAAYLAGTTPLEVAKARAAAATRQLAKRQTTWCRNQMSSWEVFQQETERFVNTFFPKILQLLLTRDD